MKRINQQELLPTSVKSRILGDVVQVSQNFESEPVTLANGDSRTFTLVLINNKKGNLLGEPEFSLWQDFISADNLIPDGANVDSTNYQIIGPWNEWAEVLVTGGALDFPTPPFTIVSRLFIRNISAGTVDIIARARLRYLTNLDDVSGG